MSDYTAGDTTLYKLDCTREPVSDETGQLMPNTDYVQGNIFWVQFGDRFWCCVDSNDVAALKFVEVSAIGLAPDGWSINSERSYSTRSTPEFDTSYTPSSINDTHVIAIVKSSLSVLENTQIDFQIDFGDGFVVIATIANDIGLAVPGHTGSFSVIVPANKSYKIIESGTGTNTLIGIKELSL
jgi:hypothetical protein